MNVFGPLGPVKRLELSETVFALQNPLTSDWLCFGQKHASVPYVIAGPNSSPVYLENGTRSGYVSSKAAGCMLLTIEHWDKTEEVESYKSCKIPWQGGVGRVSP